MPCFGEVVGRGHVRPDDAELSVIKELPVPTTEKKLMRFPRLAGYCHYFYTNISAVVAPPTDLLKAKAKFIWSTLCQPAFVVLCSQLGTAV